MLSLLALTFTITAQLDRNPQVEALVNAAYSGDAAKVKALLKKGVDPNARAANGDVAILEAAIAGRTEVVSVLIANGARDDVEMPTTTRNAFGAAARGGHLATLKVLLQRYDGNRNGVPHRWHHVLACAASGGQQAVIDWVMKDFDLNSQGNIDFRDDKSTALHRCAEWGDGPCIKTLLRLGANPALYDVTGRTARAVAGPALAQLFVFVPLDCSDTALAYLASPEQKAASTADKASARLLKNEIFARHGHSFKSDDLRAHFAAQPWYVEQPGHQVAPDQLCPAERAAIDQLIAREKSAK